MSLDKTLLVLLVATIVLTIPTYASHTIYKRGLYEEAERIVQESRHISTNNVGQLIDLVKRHNAVDCLRRVICKLTNNPHSYDNPGQRFGQALLSLRQSKHPEIKTYLDAMSQGVRVKSAECETLYPVCAYSNKEIINVGNKVLRS